MLKYIASQVTLSYVSQDETDDEDNPYDSRRMDGEALELNATNQLLNLHGQCKTLLRSETVNQAHGSTSTG